MAEKQTIKEVAEAIAAIQDHGDGCMCSQCQADKKTIDTNSDVSESLIILTKRK